MKEVVLFVPGIFGSRLRAPDGEEVWPPTPREVLMGYGRTDRLLGELQPNGVVETVCVDVYGKIVRALEGLGYTATGLERRLIAYGYDWRRDLLSLADELDAALTALHDEHGPGAAIKLICHSMGGLLVRACLERPRQAPRPWSAQVKLAVFLATPHQGAPLAFARAIGVGGSSMGVSERDLRRLAAANGYSAAYQLFSSASLKPIWDLEGATPLAPLSLFDSTLAGPMKLTQANLNAAGAFQDALDPTRRPEECRYFAIASAAHETVTRFDMDLGELAPVRVKASGDGTVPITSAAALPIQTAFVEANHMGVPQKEATHRLIGMLLGRTKPGPVIAASGMAAAPTLSLSERLVERNTPVEIVLVTPPRDRLAAEIRIEREIQGGGLAQVDVLRVDIAATGLTRVELASPRLEVGRHVFTLIVDGVLAEEEELLVTGVARADPSAKSGDRV